MLKINKNPVFVIRSWLWLNIALLLLASIFGIERGLSSKYEAQVQHADRIEPHRYENSKTRPNWDTQLLKSSKPSLVNVGIYVERITEVSLPDAKWVADFYVWFRWEDEKLDPGKTFQVVDGEIISKEPIKKQLKIPPFYQQYRVKARMTKFFNTERYPRDDHLLTIKIEDASDQIYKFQYEPDVQGSAVSSRVKLQGYHVYKNKIVQKYHSYKTSRGDESSNNEVQDTYSQLIYGIWIKRPGWGNYIKMFEGLFAAVAVSMLSFFIRTTTTNRISLGVGAFFAAVAATYVATKNIPNVGVLTLTDVITGVAMLMVFLVIWHTIIATRLYEVYQDESLVRKFDMYGFSVFFIGFIVVNISLVASELI